MKRSNGLIPQEIILQKFSMKPFIGEMLPMVSKAVSGTIKGTAGTKRAYKKEIALNNPDEKLATHEFWEEIKKKGAELEIDLMGFAEIDEDYIFTVDHTCSIETLYNNGIVLGMEMDFENINDAPGPKAGYEAQRIYSKLGMATMELADYIRSQGYGAIACHPLGGPILYPAMAVKANMGEIGRNGFLLTKKFGPRQRLSLVSTNASPLPPRSEQKFGFSDFCASCGVCIRKCPSKAILETPIVKKNGITTRIESKKCFEYFYETVGCSVCIKSCPFHKKPYDVLVK